MVVVSRWLSYWVSVNFQGLCLTSGGIYIYILRLYCIYIYKYIIYLHRQTVEFVHRYDQKWKSCLLFHGHEIRHETYVTHTHTHTWSVDILVALMLKYIFCDPPSHPNMYLPPIPTLLFLLLLHCFFSLTIWIGVHCSYPEYHRSTWIRSIRSIRIEIEGFYRTTQNLQWNRKRQQDGVLQLEQCFAHSRLNV